MDVRIAKTGGVDLVLSGLPFLAADDRPPCTEDVNAFDVAADIPGGQSDSEWVINARTFCRRCEHREGCLEWAITHNQHGVWGGTSDRQREAIRRSRRKQAAAQRERVDA